MSVVTFGEILLRLSPPDHRRLPQAQQLNATYGGAEANVAASLAHFGLDTQFVTKLPENPVGDACLGHLRRYGVGTTHVVRGGDRLGIYFLEPGASQRPSTVTYDRAHSAITTITPDEIDWADVFDEATWFHWSGITPALGDRPRSVLRAGLEAAQDHGLTISCDLNYRSKLWEPAEARTTMRPLMDFVDVCLADEGAADACLDVPLAPFDADEGTREAANALLAEHLRTEFDFDTVSLTLRESFSASEHGWSAMLLGGGLEGAEPLAEPRRSDRYMIQLVDRVGGGDSFAAGLIYGLLTKDRASDALEFATAASCLKQTIPGDFNLSTVAEVEALVEQGGRGGQVQR